MCEQTKKVNDQQFDIKMGKHSSNSRFWVVNPLCIFTFINIYAIKIVVAQYYLVQEKVL